MSIAKNWCFTLNNYTADDVNRLSTQLEGVTYLVFGKEVGDSGTPHLQGFVSLTKKKRLTQVKSLISERANLSVARNVAASIQYCKKDGDYFETGSQPAGRGQRSDLGDFKRAVQGGEFRVASLREQFSDVFARYPRFCYDYIRDNLPRRVVPAHDYREWQADLDKVLAGPTSDRHILFVVDVDGNAGKSWFVDFQQQTRPDDVVTILPGKKADMAYALMTDQVVAPRVIFLDAPRSKQGEFLQYDILEDIKNGRVFNSKYESRMLTFEVPHLVVMMNEYPDKTKLSRDRYVIWKIMDGGSNYVVESHDEIPDTGPMLE